MPRFSLRPFLRRLWAPYVVLLVALLATAGATSYVMRAGRPSALRAAAGGSAERLAPLTAGAGLLVSLLLFAITRAQGEARSRADEARARAERTAEELRQSEQALRESERRFRVMADSAPVMIWVADADGRATYFNQTWLGFTGREAERERGDGWTAGVHADDLEARREGYVEAVALRRPFELEYRLLRLDGAYRWVLDRGAPRFAPDGSFAGYIGSVLDITEIKATQAQLRELNETLEERVAARTAKLRETHRRLRTAGVALTHSEQRERRRIAEGLHEHLGQILATIKMHLSSLSPTQPAERLARGLDAANALLADAIASIRGLTFDLSPPVLYELGLGAALAWLAEQVEHRHRMRVEVDAAPDAEPRSEHLRVLLFHAVRELLQNVVKHAGTDRAEVTLQREGEEFRLSVADPGVGMPGPGPDDAEASSGLGLFNIRERMEYLGGRFQVDAPPAGGTRVSLIVPVEADAVELTNTREVSPPRGSRPPVEKEAT